MSTTERVGVVPEWTLPDRFEKARRVAGMTQTDLAEQLGISVKTVKRYESGEPYKRGILLGWALACGVHPQWLEHGNEPDSRVTEPVTLGSLALCAA